MTPSVGASLGLVCDKNNTTQVSETERPEEKRRGTGGVRQGGRNGREKKEGGKRIIIYSLQAVVGIHEVSNRQWLLSTQPIILSDSKYC